MLPSRVVVPPGHPIDPTSASGLLANWGFLAEPDLPDRPGPAWLLLAIRPVSAVSGQTIQSGVGRTRGSDSAAPASFIWNTFVLSISSSPARVSSS